MRCIYICILSASCEQECNFVSTRVCILVVFFRWYHIHSVFGGLWQTHHASLRSTLSFRGTTSIDLHSHCVCRLTHTVPLSPSHRVVYLAHTVLLTSVLLLPSLAQCLLHCCNCVTRTVAYQSLPCTMSCSSITLYCNPPQRVSAVLSIPTLQWYTYEHICILSDSCNSPRL